MIEDARKIDSPEIRAEVAIVGTGPAGLAIASRLLGSRCKVLLLEAGSRSPDLDLQHSVWSAGHKTSEHHPPLHLYRRRVLGGTSTVWGGRCVPLVEADVEAIPDIRPESWPISYRELADFYPAALEFLDAGAYEFDAGNALCEPLPHLLSRLNGVNLERIDRYSLPTNVAQKFRKALAAAKNTLLLLNAPCVEVVTASNARVVDGVRCQVDGRDLRTRAPLVVLANGGLESTRLLLASNSLIPAGLGNERGLVGRYYMTHLAGMCGNIVFNERSVENLFDLRRTSDGVYCQRTIQISDTLRRQSGMMNFALRPTAADSGDPRHNNAVLSSYYLARRLMTAEHRRKMEWTSAGGRAASGFRDPRMYRHLANITRKLPDAVAFAARWTVGKRMLRRRIPLLFVRREPARYPLEYNSEQRPNPLSRVFLNGDFDPLGMPRLGVDWRITEEDRRTVVQGYELVRNVLGPASGMTLTYDNDELQNVVAEPRPAGGHHIGTARMGDSQSTGVVGPECEVWGTKGLFVASAAVFPTSGVANPTLTVVALSLRLAEHIRAALKL